MDKRKKAKTPPPPRISSRIRANPPSRSRSSRPTRDTNLPRSPPPKRRLSSSPGKNVPRKPRKNLRPSIEPRRTINTSKNRERTPEKKYVEKLQFEGLEKEHQRPSYTKEAIKDLSIRIPNYCNEKFIESNSHPNSSLNKTLNLEKFTVVRRQGKNVKKVKNFCVKKPRRKKRFKNKLRKFFTQYKKGKKQ